MYQQNKNENLIVIKKRRILSRTEQSRQKLQANLNTNHALFKTPKPKSSKIIQLSKQQNPPQYQYIQNKNLDQIIFWNTAKKKDIRAQFKNRQKTQSLMEFLSPKKHINLNDHQRPQTKYTSKMFGLFKKKIFSHKTLRQGVGKIRNNISESLLRINNDESIQNETPSKKLQMEDSEDGTDRTYNLMGIKQFTKRFKTEDTERDVNMQKIIQGIYSNRRRKLRLNSNQFSVQLRIKKQPQSLHKEESINVRQQGTSITMKTSNQKYLLKLPNQLINQPISKSDKSECSSTVNFNYSEDHNPPEDKVVFCGQQKNVQPIDQQPYHRNKSKTMTNKQLPKIDQQIQIARNNQLVNQEDRRFIKKKSFQHVQEVNKPVSQSQTISIQDIQVVCFNEIQEIGLVSQKIENQIPKANTPVISIAKVSNPNAPKTANSFPQTNTALGSNKIKGKTINLQPIQKKQSRIVYNDDQIQFIQEINFAHPQQHKPQPISQKTEDIREQATISQSIIQERSKNNEQKSEEVIKPIEFHKKNPSPDQQTSSKSNKQQNQIRNQHTIQSFIISKSYVQSLNLIGEVGGECSQFFPKKNLSWMVPTLLLYTYCLNFRISTKNNFQQAFEDQLCDENSLQQFLEQNQQLQQNISKIYQKTKKKGIISSQIQFFLLPNFDFSKEKLNLIQKSYIQIAGFLNLLLKSQEKKSLNYRECHICAIKMIRAFLLVMKIQCQKKSKQVKFRFTQLKKKQMFTVSEINLDNLGEKQSDQVLDKEYKLLKENYEIFCQLMVR